MVTHNAERGEVPLTVGGVEIVIAATMQGLAAVSAQLKCQSFGELYSKLVNVEVNAVIAGIECLTIRGDAAKAGKNLSLKDLPECRTAFLAAMLHHAEGVPGKKEAAEDETKASLGGTGANSPLDA